MVLRYGNLVSYDRLAYSYRWDYENPILKDFVTRVYIMEPYWRESMST